MLRTAPALSALARKTMRAAFEDLERTISPADAREMRSMTAVEQVRASALQIETQMAARESLRNLRRLVPLLTGLEHYQKVMDRLCQGVPFLSWAWSPISLILRVASEYVEAFEHIMKGYTKIANALGRFGILSDAFHGEADFQQTLAVFYVDILEFHKHAYKFVRRSGWKLLFLTSWGRFGRRFDNILQDLNRHGDLIDNEANARNIAEARQMRQDIRAWREESLEEVRRDDENETSKQYLAILSWLKIDEMEQTSIFESIFEEGTKFSGTSAWLLKNEKISAWLRKKPDPALVLLQGNPGSGKSVISAHLVNFFRASKSPVVHHFCTYTYASSTKYDGILKSLLLQILRQNGDLIAHVYQEYVLNRKLPSTTNLEKLLQTHVASLSDEPRQPEYLWIVLDGVNECETARQARLISLMNQISSSSAGGTVLKILISTRSSSAMGKLLRNKQTISLSDETSSLEVAIRNYAAGRLRSLQERLRQLELESEEIEEIEHLVAQKAEGMFLYARLALDYVGANIFYSGDELKEAISQLPPTLADFYHKLLTNIVAPMDAQSRDRVRSTFAWIAFAQRPLKKLELLSALAFSSGNPNTTKLAPRYAIEDICSSLIEERRDSTLAFIHISVKDFLQSSSSPVALAKPEALQEHGVAAVTCLLSGLQIFDDKFDEQKRLLRLIKGLHSFHIYATEYWTEYLLESATALGGLDTASSLFTLAHSLAESLEESEQLQYSADALDDRLSHLQQHPLLYKHISWALKVRSQEAVEAKVFQESSKKNSDPSAIMDGISTMLDSYQQAIETLLHLDSYPGASAEELDVFKKQFRTSAFTCRLRFCPRATIGFHTDQLRQEHETIHAGGIRCTILGCQYPPLRSSQALKAHMQKHHSVEPGRKPIRRVKRMDFRNLSASVVVERKVDNHLLKPLHERTAGTPSGNNRASPAVDISTPPRKKLSLSDYKSRRSARLMSSQSPMASVSRDLPSTTFTSPPSPTSVIETIGEADLSMIKCICGFSDDDGNTVLCEKCDTWQHVFCYYGLSDRVPEFHECIECLPRPLDNDLASRIQQQRTYMESLIVHGVRPEVTEKRGTLDLFNNPEATESRKRALTDDLSDEAAPPPTFAPTSPHGRKRPLTEDPFKTLVCRICNRHFRRLKHLERHIRSLHKHETYRVF